MSTSNKVIEAAFESDEAFQQTLLKVIKEDLGLTAIEFSEHSGIPPSTLYKLMSGNREPNLRTIRQIVKTIRKIEGQEKGDFIAVIAARPVLDNINETKKKICGNLCTIREYSATTMEEAIIAAVRAEREGAKALVCAPIVSPTVEKILRIPVSTIMPKNSLVEAIENVARKVEIEE
ncbi:putative transcriptional regulator [Methanohalophilus levihalophilus]|uniref:helix-turn-helix domain-containing protein n=1 Tax=Methanohalophilus levihalophilus TaxID=1431282 RepID=UPI001AE91640|nr:helix-turn-helix domain-containing protein [Methanohalophilus levihalophilus]MBP2030197.1 putative transcriptional regulator [Methanohalophilus levihalophilus]